MWKNAAKSVKTNIIIGLFLVTPLVVTLLIINFIFTALTNFLVRPQWLESGWGILYRLAALIIVVLGVYCIGLLTRNFIGKSLYQRADKLLARIPLINTIYVSLRQISESVLSSRNNMFKQVVAVPFPKEGMSSLGFVTSQLTPETARSFNGISGQDLICVFVPTAPNPTTGFLLMLPRASVLPLKISVADAMKMVMSAGAVVPGMTEGPKQTLLDHLEKWLYRDEAPEAGTPAASAGRNPA